MYIQAQDLERIMVDLYTNIFSSNSVTDFAAVISRVRPRATVATNNIMCQPYSPDEVYQTLLQTHLGKAPGLDRLNPFFYQNSSPQ